MKLHNFEEKDWSFNAPEEWEFIYPSCSKNQSPINIVTDLLVNCNLLCELAFRYKPVECLATFEHNTPILRFNPTSSCKIKFKNQLYSLDLITIHTPSLHHIDGEYYSMEVCLWHNYKDFEPVIISCLYQEGNVSEDSASAKNFLKEIIDYLPKEYSSNPVKIPTSKQWNPINLIPNRRSFFNYEGSFPIPPCNYGKYLKSDSNIKSEQNINWIVFEKIGNIDEATLEMIKFNIGKNARPVQPIRGRTVYYNPSVETSNFDLEEKNPEITTDNQKFLKCVKKTPEKITKSVKELNVEIEDEGLDIDTIKNFQKTFYGLIIILLMYGAMCLVKKSFKSGKAQKILDNMWNASQKNQQGGNIIRNFIFKYDQMKNNYNGNTF